jgi:hypothetical protein
VLYGRSVGLALTPHRINQKKLQNNGPEDQKKSETEAKREALEEIRHLRRLSQGRVGELGNEERKGSGCKTRVPLMANCSSFQGVPK